MEPVDDPASSSPFAPPRAPVNQLANASVDAPLDIHFTMMRVGLWLVFGLWIMLVLVSVPAYISIAHDQPPFGPSLDPTVQGLILAAVVDVFYSPPALCGLFANIGFSRGRRWAHPCAVVAYAFCVLCCFPLGGYGLWVLLRERTRSHFYPA